jgi:pyruvate dehydrogenase (quinone)/pyruvate oxidase
VKNGQKYSLSGTLATMACGLPYAIAAQVAYPDRPSVAFVGDGGLSMLMAELATCVKYKLPVKIVVIKNGTLGQIKWEQMVFLGNPEYVCELQEIDFVKVAEACGVRGLRIERPGECGRVLDEAFAHDGPVLVEAVVDGQEPPFPAKIDMSQAKHFAEALVKGTPHRGQIALTVTKDKVRELI